MRLLIAGLSIDIVSGDTLSSFSQFEDFVSQPNDAPADISITLHQADSIEMPRGDAFLDDTNKWIVANDGSGDITVVQCSRRAPESEPIFVVQAKRDWTEAKVTFLRDNANVAEEVMALIGNIIFRNRFALKNGLVIHASAIAWNGKGILFTAPAGTGKSTQSRLWCELQGARIINDDSPSVRLVNGQPVVYGTPWSGSKPIFENASVPLSAIIVLEQAAQNQICTLSTKDAVPMILPRCFLPYHDSILLEKVISVFSEIVETIPSYYLKCRPDNEAVRLVTECLR